MRDRMQDQPRHTWRGLVVLRPPQSLTKEQAGQMQRQRCELPVSEILQRKMQILRRKARAYARFAGGRFEAEDLLQTAICVALATPRARRDDESFVACCDRQMAADVKYKCGGVRRSDGARP